MLISRRTFLAGAAALPAIAAHSKFKVGVTDWNLRQAGKLDAVALAASLGFDGVEVSLGRKPVDDHLPMDNAEIQAQYLDAFATHKIRIAGTCLDILHVNYLKNDKLGQKWVADGIQVTKRLKAKVMLLPFFGKGALTTNEEKDYVGDVLKELAPEAQKAGITMGLEDTISAEDNVRIMDRAGNPKSLLVYYDVGNSTRNGFEVVREIKWLGGKRICQVHLKDNPGYMGEGKIDFPKVIQALTDIGFAGFANLETESPSKVVEADMKRNLTYVRKLMIAV